MSDRRLRELERLASQGDPQAIQQLEALRNRLKKPKKPTKKKADYLNLVKKDDFLRGYLEMAMNAAYIEEGSEFFNSDIDRFTVDALKEAIKECNAFRKLGKPILDEIHYQYGVYPDSARNGVDFWLTRNRDGAGFWDQGYGMLGTEITNLAHTFSEKHVEFYRGQYHFY